MGSSTSAKGEEEDVCISRELVILKFCSDNGIRHEVSSPYNSQSNGHAEASVKNVKGLIIKVSMSGFDNTFFAWRNTVCNNGVASPARNFSSSGVCSVLGQWSSRPPSTFHQGSPCKKKIQSNVSDSVCSDLKLQPRADKLRPFCVGNEVLNPEQRSLESLRCSGWYFKYQQKL